MNTDNCYVNTKKAAEILGYTERYVTELSVLGKLLGAVKMGGRWKIPLISIDRFHKQQKELVSREAKAARLLKPYVLLYLSTVGQKIQETGNEILELETQPIVDDHSKNRIAELQNMLEGLKQYYVRILVSLSEAEV